MTNQSTPKFTLAIIVSVFLLLCSCTSVLERKQTVRAAATLFQTEQQLNAKVIRVVDGDTVVVTDQNNATIRIRLKGIDAPESSQAFGPEAKAKLTELSLNKNVQIYWCKKDPYGRVVGKLMVGNEDLCLKMLESGLAWHYKQYQLEQSSQDLIAYNQAEKEARAARRGLWNSEAPPIPPWQYRHQQQPPRKPMSDNDDNGNNTKNDRLSDSELVDQTLREMAETAFFRDFSDLNIIRYARNSEELADNPCVFELLNRLNPEWQNDLSNEPAGTPTFIAVAVPIDVARTAVAYDRCRCPEDGHADARTRPCLHCALSAAIFKNTGDELYRPEAKRNLLIIALRSHS